MSQLNIVNLKRIFYSSTNHHAIFLILGLPNYFCNNIRKPKCKNLMLNLNFLVMDILYFYI